MLCENLTKLFDTYKFCDPDINKFNCFNAKRCFPCECMDDWKEFSETSLP